MIVHLESGEWIDILPIGRLRTKHKDRVEGAFKLHVKLDANGQPDISSMPLSMSIAKIRRNALLAMIIRGWSFTTQDYDGNDEPVPGTERPLPVPAWDDLRDVITDEESYGEIGLDDWTGIEAIIKPYMDKVTRQPDPKETTTSSLSCTCRAGAGRCRTA